MSKSKNNSIKHSFVYNFEFKYKYSLSETIPVSTRYKLTLS